MTLQANDRPPSDAATGAGTPLAPEVEIVRVRLALVIGATSVIAALAGGTLVAVFAPWIGGRLEQLLGSIPAPAWLTFVAALASAIGLVV